MKIEGPLTQPYIGEIVGNMHLSAIPMKLYFANILGRETQTSEWRYSNFSQEDLARGLEFEIGTSRNVGTPHVGISFPHVTRIFRWGNPISEEQETNLYCEGIIKTPDLNDLSLRNPHGLICCPLEGYIIGEEIAFRAASRTMVDYMNKFVPNGVVKKTNVQNPNMVREFLESR